ncbi:hypothetical protein D1872_266040 [compost metagenome]
MYRLNSEKICDEVTLFSTGQSSSQFYPNSQVFIVTLSILASIAIVILSLKANRINDNIKNINENIAGIILFLSFTFFRLLFCFHQSNPIIRMNVIPIQNISNPSLNLFFPLQRTYNSLQFDLNQYRQ